MRIGPGVTLSALLAFAVGVGACHSQEQVVPFMDAGDPCSNASGSRAIDCAEFAETTCVVQGSVCPEQTYGCADAAYFTKQDYSQCPPEGGLDAAPFEASLLGDGSIVSTDAADGGSSEAGGGD